MRLFRAALAIAAVLATASTTACADVHAAPVRPALTAAELEARQHLDGVIARHLGRIRGELAARQSAVAAR